MIEMKTILSFDYLPNLYGPYYVTEEGYKAGMDGTFDYSNHYVTSTHEYDAHRFKDDNEAHEFIERLLGKFGELDLNLLHVHDSKANDVNPRKGESKEDFISRFMSETKHEYPDRKQRLAVAYSYWRNAKDAIDPNETLDMLIAEEEKAISEYNDAIKQFSLFANKQIMDTLIHIRDEEIEHKQMLERIKNL